MVVRVTGISVAPEVEVLVFGVAVVSTAFLLAWAAEAAQVDISGSLATAVLALIAVLPEYAVDLYFSYSAGHDPTRAAVRGREHDGFEPFAASVSAGRSWRSSRSRPGSGATEHVPMAAPATTMTRTTTVRSLRHTCSCPRCGASTSRSSRSRVPTPS